MKKQSSARNASQPLNAVIYARYSSHSQTEQSIEGQLHDGYAYAERCGYRVIGEYIDRALTGTKDDRPDFQRMIADAEKHQFQIVIVWKLDRFARNRYDSAIYKRQLKKHGVRVVSVMENINDSPEGIILEGLLEAMAEYYSANLAENIKRGQAESVKKGWYVGGPVPLGYQVIDHRLVRDDRTAPLVVELYQRYAAGESLADVAASFNARGYRTSRGRLFTCNSFHSMIPNSTYIGDYTFSGQIIPGVSDPLIDPDLYDRAVRRRDRMRRAPASGRGPVSFLLQGKLFCGLCGAPMFGDCGTARSGERKYYYSCSAKRHKRTGCRKKAEKQDFLEWYVCEQTVKYILDPARLDQIASTVTDLYNSEIDDDREKDLLRAIQRLKDEMNTLIDKLIIVPKEAAGPIGERMKQVELQRLDLEADLTKLRLQQKVKIEKSQVSAWLRTFSHGDLFDAAFRASLIDTFINSIYLWNEKIVIFYNISGAQETIGLDEISALDEMKEAGQDGSSLTGNGGAFPTKVEPNHAFVFLRGQLGLVIFRE